MRSARIALPEIAHAGIFAAFCVLFAMAFTRNVNWDEFYFLSHIHAHLDGRLDRPLQTVFVHAFGWLAHVSDHEVDQITVARLTMTALLGGTTFAIFYIASAVTENRTAASVATIAFLTSGFVLPHGASFRADPIAAAGLMAALAIMMTGRIGAWQILTIAALSALSLLVTVKAALYLPAYLAALLWRADDPRIVLRICFSGLLALALAGALFSLHSTSIAPAPGAEASTNMSDALNTALLETRPFPRAHEAILWAALSFPALLLAGTGLVSPMTARKRIVLVGLALPLLFSVVFYRNAFPYFFPFIVPPLMIVVAIGAARVRQKNVLGILVVTMLGTGAWQAIKALSEDSQLQRETIAEVHRLFPEPVAYIDHNAMISSFPRSLFFMSTWGVESYRKAGRPVIAGYIARDAPPFLLANRWALQFAMMAPDAEDSRLMLLPEDRRVLRDTYVHYSGAIWLAGKDAVLDSGETRVELTIPGRYRLESPVTISIDGEEVTPNEVIDVVDEVLVRGPENTPIRLVWDTGQPPRPNALPQGALYAGF